MMPDPLEPLRLPVIPVEPRPVFAAGLLRRPIGEQVPARGTTVRYFVADPDAAVAAVHALHARGATRTGGQ